LHQVGDLFELNVKRQCQKVKIYRRPFSSFSTSVTHFYIIIIIIDKNHLAWFEYK